MAIRHRRRAAFRTGRLACGWRVLKTSLRAVGRFMAELARAQHRDQLHLHAAALAYTTLFSFVPLLTVALVMVGRVQPERAAVVVRAIATVFPFSPIRVQATLTAFAERTASLGTLAIVISILVIFNTFYQIEEVVNTIWGVPNRRRWQVRLLSFATVLVSGPFLVAALFSALYWLSSRSWYPEIVLLARPLPALLAMVTLAALYRWTPHTHVPWRAAWVGAGVAASSLTILHLAFQTYLDLASDLNVIYGSLALVLFFLISLYLFWLALLLGAEASWVLGHAMPPHPESAGAVVDLLLDLQVYGTRSVAQAAAALGGASQEILAQLAAEPPLLVISRGDLRLARPGDTISLGEVRARIGAPSAPDDNDFSVATLAKHREREGEPAGGPLSTVEEAAHG